MCRHGLSAFSVGPEFAAPQLGSEIRSFDTGF